MEENIPARHGFNRIIFIWHLAKLRTCTLIVLSLPLLTTGTLVGVASILPLQVNSREARPKAHDDLRSATAELKRAQLRECPFGETLMSWREMMKHLSHRAGVNRLRAPAAQKVMVRSKRLTGGLRNKHLSNKFTYFRVHLLSVQARLRSSPADVRRSDGSSLACCWAAESESSRSAMAS